MTVQSWLQRVQHRLVGKSAAWATPVFLQNDPHECGAVCLRIVLAHYNVHLPIAELRKCCGTSRQGFRLDYLAKTARAFGMKATGVSIEPDRLDQLALPLIALWNFNHLVVVESVGEQSVFINDPARGRMQVTRAEFDEAFCGVALVITKDKDCHPVGQPVTLMETLAKRLHGSTTPFLFVVLSSLGLIVPGWVLPSFTRQFVDEYFNDRQIYWLWPLILGMVITLVVQAGFSYLQQNSLQRLQTKLAVSWGVGFFWHLLRLPLSFFAERHAGDLTNRFKFVDRVASQVAGQLTIGLMNLVAVVFYGTIMLEYHVGLACVSFLTVAVGWLVLSRKVRQVGEASESWYVERGAFFGSALTMLTFREQFKSNGSENALFSLLVGRHTRVIDANQRQEWRRIMVRSGIRAFEALHAILVLVFGAKLIMTGTFTMGTMIAYQILAASFMAPVVAMIGLNMRLYEAKAMIGAMDEILEHPAAHEFDNEWIGGEDPVAAQPATGLERPYGAIQVENLSFAYNPFDPPVIDAVNLTIEPGSRVALIGTSGSGRSTLGHLIAGLYPPSEGRITFGGRTCEEIPRHEFRSHVAMLEQSSLLFDTSIRNNLTLWDKTIPEDQMVMAAKAAMIHDVIVERDGGYDHMVKFNGTNFSSGECQRLEIARVLAQKPSVLIMDESTSFLDAIVEEQIVENVRRLGITCIFIAHRLNTIKSCNQIVVMQHGRIVEQGNHEELLALNGQYSRLIATW